MKISKCLARLIVTIPVAVVNAADISAADQLLDINYRFEVAGYCGLVNEQVAGGYHVERKRLLSDAEFSDQEQQTVRGKAWQAAHKEWLNRGLGGFKRWCRNEGSEYAENFTRLNQLDAAQ